MSRQNIIEQLQTIIIRVNISTYYLLGLVVSECPILCLVTNIQVMNITL